MTTAKTLRNRHLAAAKRSATLIRDALITHLAILEEGNLPESSFTASLDKYLTALTALRILDALGENAGPVPEAGEVTVNRDDLEIMIEMLQEIGPPELMSPDKDSPLGNLIEATGQAS